MISEPYRAADERYDCGMKYERCGASGLLLPRISLGLWQNFGDTVAFGHSREILHYAFDRGITCFDLANNYGPSYGSAEETFGRMMQASFRPYRDEMVVTTKAGYDMWPGPYGNWGSRKYLLASLHQSLRRMQLDYVDIFYSHRYDPATPLDETLQALVDVVRQGKALYVGISRWPLEATRYAYAYLAARDVPCLIYQGRYNMIDREVETSGVLRQAAESGVGFAAFSPLEQGVLAGRYLDGLPGDSRASRSGSLKPEKITPGLLDAVRGLAAIAARRGQSLAQMSLAWLLKDAAVTSVIVGCSSVAQLADNLRCLENTAFSAEELSEIDRALAAVHPGRV